MKTPLARVFLGILALLLGLNLVMSPAHAHFAAENWLWFWPGFGLFGGLGLAVAGGAMLAPLLRLKEDGHGR